VLQAVAGKGKPVVTVFIAGRPLFVNDLLNLSDTFVAAWLPGSEGKGVSDLLIAGPKAYDFTGRLSFSWPKSACQTPLNAGDADYAPLFALGYGLRKGQRSSLGTLDASYPEGGCGGASDTYPVFSQADRNSFPLSIRSGSETKPLGADLNATVSLPGIEVSTAQVNTQQDAKLARWSGTATLEAHGAKPLALPARVSERGVLRFDTIVFAAPAGQVTLAMRCGAGCNGEVNATSLFARIAGKGKQTVSIPLACFTGRGAVLAHVDTPFSVTSQGTFAAAFANIEIARGTDGDAGTVRCEDLK
jgi:beta-glucosidase